MLPPLTLLLAALVALCVAWGHAGEAQAQELPPYASIRAARVAWTRDVLRARPSETFAPIADCDTAVDYGGQALRLLTDGALALVTGRPRPASVFIPKYSGDVKRYYLRCGALRLRPISQFLFEAEIGTRIDPYGDLNDVMIEPQRLRACWLGIGLGAVALMGGLLFADSRHPDRSKPRWGVQSFGVSPFAWGGGGGLALVGYTY